MPSDSGAPPDVNLPLWSFRDDVVIEPAAGGSLVVLTRWGDVRVDSAAPAIVDSLYRMTLGPVELTNVDDLDRDDLFAVLARLPGCVVRSLGLKETATPLLSAVPLAPGEVLELPELDDTLPIRLSRFAIVREHDGEMVVESPLSRHRVVLHRPLTTWAVGALGRATTARDIAQAINVTRELITELLGYLVATGMVVIGTHTDGARPVFAEDDDPDLRAWSPHDLLFHSRSRLGRHDDDAGAAFRNAPHLPPLPVVRPVPAGRRFPLHRPDLTAPDPAEMSLTEAVEQRHSVREFADDGPSVEQLGELLFRAARIRSQTEAVGAGGVRYPVSGRPYPSAGALYELDLYLTVDRCADLPRGIYHYDPLDHVLTLVNEDGEQADELLDSAMVQMGARRRPPVLITMTARMGRLSWVYDSIAYATTLKHVGVLQQTLYLVATMLGLAPCAVATGDSEAATTALRLDWPAEVSVGEFVIGLPS
ncbi:SagB family peptide dehydrogenase [Actinophytocola glycyrrhizae]|uniref:SagB family peptide dehydrogenase n=1 Tax=Actinophytocola glycyrrhizae TaxID=2044873 RepID=A0ABV9S1I5_9PSEU